MAASTVTERTSVVLVSSIGTKVYLSSVGYPGHIVTIKDYSGVASQGTPIVVSTTQGISFADGTISTLLFNPFSYLTVASKTSSTWQVLNNTGFLTTLSNSFLQTLTTGNAYLALLSSGTEYVSTSVANNVTVTKSLTLLGNVDILGNITVTGTVDLLSSVNVNQPAFFSSGVTVRGPASLASSLQVKGEVTVGGPVSTLSSLFVGGDLFVSSSLYVQSALVPRNLSVQTLGMNLLTLAGGLTTSESISAGTVRVGGFFTTLSSFVGASSLLIQGSATIAEDTTIQGRLTTGSLQVGGDASAKLASVERAQVNGLLSSGGSLVVSNSLFVGNQITVNQVTVTGGVSTNSLVVSGNANISSIQATGSVEVGQAASFSGPLTIGTLTALSTVVHGSFTGTSVSVSGPLSTVTGGLTVVGDLFVGGTVTSKGAGSFGSVNSTDSLVVHDTMSTAALYVQRDLVVDENFSIQGTATVGALAAPINITLSTLTLSNTFLNTTSASIPFLTTGTSNYTFPQRMKIGTDSTPFGGFLKTPIANIRGTLEDLNVSTNRKTIPSSLVSSLKNPNLLNLFLIGSSNYINPYVDTSGLLLFGSNAGGKTVYSLFAPSFATQSISLQFSTISYGAAYAKSTWVAVGQDGQALSTIKYSSDNGRTWNPIASGGFNQPAAGPTANDVLFVSSILNYNYNGSGFWLAAGDDTLGSGANTLQLSSNGSTWTSLGQSNSPTIKVGNRLFPHTYTDSPYTTPIVGGNAGLGNFGLAQLVGSGPYLFWQPLTPAMPAEFVCQDIAEDNLKNLYAVGYSPANRIWKAGEYTFKNTNAWTSNDSATLPGPLSQLKTIAYGKGRFVIGGTPTGGNKNFSLYWSLNATNWNPTTLNGNAGFTVTVNKVVYNSTLGLFFAVGSNAGGSNLQFSPDGAIWNAFSQTFASPLYNLTTSAAGLVAPDSTTKFFTANVESRFPSGISTVILQPNLLVASSLQAAVILGDASQLSNINLFGSSILTSSILADTIQYSFQERANDATQSISPQSTIAATANFTYLYSYPQFSTQSIYNWLAAGADTFQQGTLQSTSNLYNWSRSSNNGFQYYGTSLYGNSNFLPDPANNSTTSASYTAAPRYVATGADTRTNYTIQYSLDAITWNPITKGGFATANSNGIKLGTTVTFRQLPFRFLVGGQAQGSASTIFYSDQGAEFSSATPSPFLTNSVKLLRDSGSAGQNTLGLNDSNYVIYSRDGITWNQTSTTTQFVTLAFGTSGPFTGAFAFTATGDVYRSAYSPTMGRDWTFYTTATYGLSPLSNLQDLQYGNGKWLAVGSNSIFIYRNTGDLTTWEGVPFSLVNKVQSLFYETTQQRWFLAAQANDQTNTLLTSVDTYAWAPIQSGGFSSSVTAYGIGYGVAVSSSIVLAGGQGSFAANLPIQPQLLRVSGIQYPPSASVSTTTSLSQANASNVFLSNVRAIGIASTTAQLYPYVAVGDGILPQKTIARSSNLSDWLPAVTGGFSTGFGITYFHPSTGTSMWVGVGAAAASSATIQYSPDGANWFATNTSVGLPYAGRAVTLLSTASLYRLVAVGEGPANADLNEPMKSVVYSDNGFQWKSTVTTNGFFRDMYAVTQGLKTGTNYGPSGQVLMAIGKPDPDTSRNHIVSDDGVSWQEIPGTNFDTAGYGIAYGDSATYPGVPRWVAVGEMSTPGTVNIFYSLDGENWNPAGSRPFYYAVYGVVHDPSTNNFIAVGKSLSNTLTIAYSPDGQTWNTLTNGGFLNEQVIGTAYGVYSQSNQEVVQNPFVRFSNFLAYSGNRARTFDVPTLRTTSTNVVLNETMFVGISSVTINTTTVYENATVSVGGGVRTSSFFYKGTDPSFKNPQISWVIASTMQVLTTGKTTRLETPSWGFGPSNVMGQTTVEQANLIEAVSESKFGINQTLYISKDASLAKVTNVGINTLTPGKTLGSSALVFDVNGTVGVSTLQTPIYKQPHLSLDRPAFTPIESPNLIFTTVSTFSSRNTIFSEVSSILLNTVMTIQQSTQRVGCYTANPLFDFDVRRAGYLSSLTTPQLTASKLFFTLQSL